MIHRSKLGLFVSGPKVYDYLLEYPCVVDWIEGYESRYTKDQFLRALHAFVQSCGVKPDELLGLGAEEVKGLVVKVARRIRDDKDKFKDVEDVVKVARALGQKVFKTHENVTWWARLSTQRQFLKVDHTG